MQLIDELRSEHELIDAVAGAFASLRFKVPRISAHVHWFTNTLTITNVQADFYEGTGQGWAHFIFPAGDKRLNAAYRGFGHGI